MIARNTHNPGLWWDEITVDNFAGGGGASLGLERGLGRAVDQPLHAIPTKERFGLVTVHIDGEPYIITDIGMRMLQPRELFNAQGFPREYVIDHGTDEDGRRVELTKTEQVRMCGNSVCPDVVEALVRANVPACEQADELAEVCA
jgi:site-specific DNA-cytosine methylase